MAGGYRRKRELKRKYRLSVFEADQLENILFRFNMTEEEAVLEMKLRSHYIYQRNKELEEIFGRVIVGRS